MKEATMVYRHPGKHKIHGSNFDYKIVDADKLEGGESELDRALADGWHLTTTDALDYANDGKAPDDNTPPTREEIEAKATELGISFQKNTKDETLLQKISAKLNETSEE